MKARSLTFCTPLSILLLLLLSTAAQAAEYSKADTEVKAEEILKHIENGDDIFLDNCSIVGELDVSKIELETVPNPIFDELLEGQVSQEMMEEGSNKNLSVVESNITFRNSVFKDRFYFSSVQFKSPVNFINTSFTSSTNFSYANFDSYADFTFSSFNNVDFYEANFNSNVDFIFAIFNSVAYFSAANFISYADFTFSSFNSDAYFPGVEFNYPVDFALANFNGEVDFNRANFESDADFSAANFSSYVYFSGENFNSDADFLAPATSENIITTDGKVCEIFMKSYNNEARYTDADNIYYNFRKYEQENKDSTDFSKWTDILSWITCGYGTKLSYPLGWTVFFILFFAIIYKNPSISCKNDNKKTPIRLCWGKPGIYRKGKPEEELVSFLESLYFSINIFTRLGSANWQQRDGFSKWVSLEGVLGWIIFALVSATLMRLFIRS